MVKASLVVLKWAGINQSILKSPDRSIYFRRVLVQSQSAVSGMIPILQIETRSIPKSLANFILAATLALLSYHINQFPPSAVE
jgi:hypothetical protein